MTLEMVVLCAILVTATGLFAFEVFPVDKVSFLVLGALVACGLISGEQALLGFGNPATITVGCMLILSHGIERTGALNFVANKIIDLAGGSEVKILLATMAAVGSLSAFINNTAAVAIFMPLCLAVAHEQNIAPSKLLMPMSFSAIFAGTCTLIGTSTNLLVYGIVKNQLGVTIGMFDFTAMGIIFSVVGTAYMILIGRHLIPRRRASEELTSFYSLDDFVTELILLPKSPLAGRTLFELPLSRHGLEVVEVWRGGLKLLGTEGDVRLEPGDAILVKGDPKVLLELQNEFGVRLEALKVGDQALSDDNVVLVEAFISSTSSLVESTLRESNFRRVYRSNVLAIRSHGRSVREKVATVRLAAGDSLLLLTSRQHLASLRGLRDFLLLEEVRTSFLEKGKAVYALAIFAGVVAMVALEIMSVAEASLVGVVLMAFTGCIRLSEVYSSISWTTLVMLGCLIPLGAAMNETGLAGALAGVMVQVSKQFGPVAALGGTYLLTSLLTEILSNNAAAVLMVPIAISVAGQLGVNPIPFAFAAMFAASASFMTPIGYQTNTMIFGPGGYKFSDFLRVGAPLSLLFLISAMIFIPLFWGF